VVLKKKIDHPEATHYFINKKVVLSNPLTDKCANSELQYRYKKIKTVYKFEWY
jgi:hypothetical protein